MKRLLFLGGADIQISAINKAKDLGYYVITCDYLPDNPGHKISHEYHNVSTTDKEKVLELAIHLKIDGITAYGSDPAALTAAFVSEKLGIPGNPFHSIEILANKVNFRNLQHKLEIPAPQIRSITSENDFQKVREVIGKNGGIIKPVDSSGSKGIYHLSGKETDEELKAYVKDSLSFSRAKQIVAEEFIIKKGFLMSGDYMIEDGKIIFYSFGDVHFNSWINNLVPRSISLPASIWQDKLFFEKVIAQLEKMLKELKITTGVFNADVISDENGTPYILDIGARNGGNMFNDIISYHTGFDLIGLSMRQCVGEKFEVIQPRNFLGYYAHNVIHSKENGILKSISFSEKLQKKIIFKNINVQQGQEVKKFINSGYRLGLILLKFDTFEEMHAILGDINKHVYVEVEAN